MPFRPIRTVLALEADEVARLEDVLMDGDGEEALAYLREVIGRKLRVAQDDSHRPEFEGGISAF